MLKRLAAATALIYALTPLSGFADTSSADLASPTPTPTASATSDGLGPQAVTSPVSPSESSGLLQPAGTTPQQSSSDASSGLTAPNSSLQAPPSSDYSLKVLSSEADGPPKTPAVASDLPTWPWALAVILLFMIFGAVVVYRDRRRFSQTEL